MFVAHDQGICLLGKRFCTRADRIGETSQTVDAVPLVSQRLQGDAGDFGQVTGTADVCERDDDQEGAVGLRDVSLVSQRVRESGVATRRGDDGKPVESDYSVQDQVLSEEPRCCWLTVV